MIQSNLTRPGDEDVAYTLVYSADGKRVDPELFRNQVEAGKVFEQVNEHCLYRSDKGRVMVYNESDFPDTQLCSLFPNTERERGELEKQVLSVVPGTTIMSIVQWYSKYRPSRKRA